MSNGRTDDRGQVLSSFAAVAAVVAIAAGFVILLVTRGDDSAADAASGRTTTSPPGPTARASTSAPTATVTTSDSPSATPSLPATTTEATPSLPTTTEPTQEPTPSAPATQVPTAQLPAVEVFNNTRRRGLAEDVANKARAAGWNVTGADNWHGKIVASTVYYPAGMRAEAVRLADHLGISRLKDALPNMKKDRLTVILTEDYSG